MLKNQTINLKVVEKIATTLGELNKEVIYVGGAVVSLYVTDLGAEQPRPTKDIDISVKVATYEQMDELRTKLATKKIFPATHENIMYRYTFEDILIDFIPFEKTPLGPTNRWLKPGFEKAYRVKIGDQEIRILPVSLFIATKWEAFKDRGDDPRTSHDFEDIIYILDNNKDFVDDVQKASENVKLFLNEMSRDILNYPSRNEIIECHLSPLTSHERKEIVLKKLQELVKQTGQ